MPFPSWLPLLLGLLTAVGPVSTDMYLPAFPAIERALGGAAGTAQITLATWFVGLAIGQITQGPLSDRLGRRPPLIVGTVIYTLASVGCALAPNLPALSTMRLVAALGGSASMVITRAMVRDLTDGHAAARLMSKLMLIMGAAPILAPTLGGLILAVAGWQAIFWVCAGYGAISCVLVVLLLPETLPAERRVRLSLGAQFGRYGFILRERGFVTRALMGGSAMFAMFAYLGGSPAVFIDLYHLSPPLYGGLFGLCAAGYIGSAQLNPRIIMRFGPDQVMRTALRVFLGATVLLLISAFLQLPAWWSLAIPIFLMMSTQGFIMPNATVAALSRHAGHAGSASALMGTMQFCMSAVSGVAVGVLTDGTARPMALLIVLGALAANAADFCRIKRPLAVQ